MHDSVTAQTRPANEATPSEVPVETRAQLRRAPGSSGLENPRNEQRAPNPVDALRMYEPFAARLLAEAGVGPFTLAVTSAVAGEGVSTVVAGLGMALSLSTGRNVVLVDANMRRPSLHQQFGLPLQPGLHQVASAHASGRGHAEDRLGLGHTATPTQVPRLWILPAGEAMQHPGQITTSDGIDRALSGLRAHFSYTIIDCPAVLSSADAAWICGLADAVALVVRAGVTPADEVQRAQALLQRCDVMGVVLNGA